MTSVANALFAARKTSCPLPALILMNDPRLPDIIYAAQRMPKGSAVIYRHFGDKNAASIAAQLRQICFARDMKLLIGKDYALAANCGADGVHLPQTDISKAARLRARYPDWIITAATHNADSVSAAQKLPLDAITLSPIFKSESPSATVYLGIDKFNTLAERSNLPVIALGGINADTAPQLLGSGAAGLAGVSGIVPARM